MKYGITAATQISRFLSAFGLGMLLSLLYYAVVFIRSAISDKKGFIIFQDVFISVVTSFLFFVFFESYTYGEFRIDLVISAFMGFLVSSFCFKALFYELYKKGIKAFRLFLKAFFSPLVVLFLFVKKLKNTLVLLIKKLFSKIGKENNIENKAKEKTFRKMKRNKKEAKEKKPQKKKRKWKK